MYRVAGPDSEGPFARMGARWTVISAVIGAIGVLVAVIAIFAGTGGEPKLSPSSTSLPTSTVVIATPDATSVAVTSAPDTPLSKAAGLVTYIEDLQYTPDSNPYDNRDIAQINGQSYEHSQAAQFCFGDDQRKWTYVLGRKYASFQGVVGLSDNSTSAATIRFELIADGQTTFSQDLRVGQSAPLDLPVTGVLHLELLTTLLTHDGGCGAASGEWADIRAVG